MKLPPLVAAPHAQIQPPVAEHVHRRRLLGELDGIVEGEDGHGSSQPDGVGDASQVCQNGRGGRHDAVAGEVVLGEPYGTVSQPLGVEDLLQGLAVVSFLL